MIGIDRDAPGRLGNKLFHYHFLRQVARKARAEYFHPQLVSARFFLGMNKRPRPFSLFKKQIALNSADVLALGSENFLDFIQTSEKEGKDILLKGPFLGEVFFQYLFYSPSEFIQLRPEFHVPLPLSPSTSVCVGVHFRGTDFKQWNEHASLSFPYYRDAIELCLQEYNGKEVFFALFTDDTQFSPFCETILYLQKHGLVYHVSENLFRPYVDFYQLSQCDVIISSPSTFNIFAGAIGKDKKIIHSKEWLMYCLERRDAFWVSLSGSKNPYYQLWKTV